MAARPLLPQPPSDFQLGPVTVEPARNRVIGASGPIGIEPKVMAVLCYLAGKPGDVIARVELIDQVWGVEHGGDESLTRAVSLLRKALNDSKSIETVSKRGYRLTLPVTARPKAPAVRPPVRHYGLIALGIAVVLIAAGWLLWQTLQAGNVSTAPGGMTVMVEPFTADAGQATAPQALSRDLAGTIAGYSLYKVISAPVSARKPDGLAYILRGNLRRDGSLAVQLIDAKSDDHIWAQTYTGGRPAGDVVTIVASELQSPMLTAAKGQLKQRPILSLKPWELNLLVTWVPGAEGAPPGPPSENSFWLQKRALEIDPDYAPAHATFAEMLAYHALFDPPSDTPQARERARQHAERALQLAPFDAEVLYHVAKYHQFSGDRERALALYQRVLALQPSYLTAQADLYFVQGQCQADNAGQIAALTALNERMSPGNPARWVTLSHLAELHLGNGDMSKAADHARRSRDIVTTTWSSFTLSAAMAASGDRTELARVAHEHDAQWIHMDYGWFADHAAARWCLNGPKTPQVAAAFRRLAQIPAP